MRPHMLTGISSANRQGAEALRGNTSRASNNVESNISHQPSKDINMAPAESARIDEAKKLAKTDPRKAEIQYKEIISKPPSVTSDAAVREYETALVSLGELYRDEK